MDRRRVHGSYLRAPQYNTPIGYLFASTGDTLGKYATYQPSLPREQQALPHIYDRVMQEHALLGFPDWKVLWVHPQKKYAVAELHL